MNPAAVNSFPYFIQSLENEFQVWELKGTRDFGSIKYVSFVGDSFCDLHVKQVQKLARQHGFKLHSFNVSTTNYGKLLVTFVLTLRRVKE